MSEDPQESKALTRRGGTSGTSTRRSDLFEQIRLTAEVCGAHLAGDTLLMIVSDMLPYPDELIEEGLHRCRCEVLPVKGFVTFNLAIVLEKMGVTVGEALANGLAESAWEKLTENFRFYDESSGGYWIGKHPELEPRAVDALRAVGDWEQFERWATRQFLHLLKRDFIEAYKQRPNVEAAGQLTAGDVKQLIGSLAAAKVMR